MPFRTPPDAPRDLLSLIDAELRERLEEAIDHACLEAMVSARRSAGAPAPAADNARDREEFTASVRALLVRLRDEIPAVANEVAGGDEEGRLLAVQLGRAKALPDYWQRFDDVRQRFTAEYAPGGAGASPSGGPSRGVIGRLFRAG